MIKEFHPELLPKIHDLSIKANQRYLSQTFAGNWLSTIKGRGMEFAGYRTYNSGDDASMIDWRASLRARRILVKELSEERNLNVIIMLDVSNSMLYGSGDLLKAEYAAEIVSSIAFAALRTGDAVGLTLFNDKITNFVEPSIGMGQHKIIADIISRGENYGGAYDIGKPLLEVMGAMSQRGLIIIVSDFIGLSKHWDRYIKIASQKFEMVGVMVRDKRDRTLPKQSGEYVLEDPYNDEKIIIDSAQYWRQYADYVRKEERAISEAFKSIRSDLIVLQSDGEYIKPLMNFFHRRTLKISG